MRGWQGQSHIKWYCKYHVVFVPKYRKRSIYGPLRRSIGRIIRESCRQAKIELVEGYAMADHVHLCLNIPPKFHVANTVGFLKGKSSIRIHREFLGQKRHFTGLHFWAKGYCVSTIGLDEQTTIQYIRNQEAEEKRLEQMLFEGL
jgi:putative transposase